MNKKVIIGLILGLLVFVAGFVSVQVFDIKLPFSTDTTLTEYMFPVEGTITTNIKDSRSYVKCEIVLTVSDEAEFLDMVDNSFKIKDAIIEVLRAMEEYEYFEDGLQIALSEKIINSLSHNFNYTHITKVFFEQLITQ